MTEGTDDVMMTSVVRSAAPGLLSKAVSLNETGVAPVGMAMGGTNLHHSSSVNEESSTEFGNSAVGTAQELTAQDLSSSVISPNHLAAGLNELCKKFMLLDVRPFGAFHRGHIESAFSVGCSAMLLRRLARGRSRVRDLIADDQRAQFVAMQGCTTVVLYDEHASSLACTETNPLHVFMTALHREGVHALYLAGGYQRFAVQYPSVCKDFKNSGMSLTLQLPMPTTGSGNTVLCGSLSSSAVSHAPHFQFNTPGPADYESRKANLFEPPSVVLPGLLLGSRNDAENFIILRDMDVAAILNVTQAEHTNRMPGVRYKQLPVRSSCVFVVRGMCVECMFMLATYVAFGD